MVCLPTSENALGRALSKQHSQSLCRSKCRMFKISIGDLAPFSRRSGSSSASDQSRLAICDVMCPSQALRMSGQPPSPTRLPPRPTELVLSDAPALKLWRTLRRRPWQVVALYAGLSFLIWIRCGTRSLQDITTQLGSLHADGSSPQAIKSYRLDLLPPCITAGPLAGK